MDVEIQENIGSDRIRISGNGVEIDHSIDEWIDMESRVKTLQESLEKSQQQNGRHLRSIRLLAEAARAMDVIGFSAIGRHEWYKKIKSAIENKRLHDRWLM